MKHENIDRIALMEKVNAGDGPPDPYSFTSEEWSHLQELGFAAGPGEAASTARAVRMMDIYMKRKYGGEPNASYVGAMMSSQSQSQNKNKNEHEYKRKRAENAEDAGKSWSRIVFWLAVFALIGWFVA